MPRDCLLSRLCCVCVCVQGEGIYGMGEHRGSARCTNQCVNTSLPIRQWDWEIQHSQDVHFLPNNGVLVSPCLLESRQGRRTAKLTERPGSVRTDERLWLLCEAATERRNSSSIARVP